MRKRLLIFRNGQRFLHFKIKSVCGGKSTVARFFYGVKGKGKFQALRRMALKLKIPNRPLIENNFIDNCTGWTVQFFQ
jgi:hypothetical protein